MTQKIKQFLIVLATITIPLGVTITPSPALAESDREFWKMPFVKDIKTIWTEKKQNDSLIKTIQTAINWVLGLFAYISISINFIMPSYIRMILDANIMMRQQKIWQRSKYYQKCSYMTRYNRSFMANC